jgi:hypothetical protein
MPTLAPVNTATLPRKFRSISVASGFDKPS